MSTITELNPRLLVLTEAGVSVWPDQIRRSMVEGGEFAREDLDSTAIYEHIAIRDVELAADATGQLDQGGPPTGRIPQVVAAPHRDAEIPGAGYTFGTLIAVQAAGDLETLRAHGLPAERVEAEGDPADADRALTERITAILQEN